MPASWPTCCARTMLEPVYHGETGVRMLRELARSYLTIVKDLTRVMNRMKALYRGWAIPCAGPGRLLYPSSSEWLDKIEEAGVRRRAERLYQQLDMLQHLRQQARRELLAESRKHAITAKLRQIPSLGPIRSALAVALIQTPHRFRTKRQLWAYSGLGFGNPRQCGIPLCQRRTATFQETDLHSRSEQGPQP